VTGGILMIFELLICLFYLRYLYKRAPIESMDDIPGFKLVDARYGLKRPGKRRD